MNSSDALISISDDILSSIASLNKLEYNKNGRKYKFINNGFQRIKQADKHLLISTDASLNCSVISSYSILHTINQGKLLQEYPDFCLAIIGVARELETHNWVESSNVISYTNQFDDSSVYPPQLIHDALEYSNSIQQHHLDMGLSLLVASKLNFFHTDHHLGTKIYGVYLIKYMKEFFGEDSVNIPDILVALKSFVHWGSIKCILYKLQVPNVLVSDEEFLCYKSFPDPAQELKEEIWNKYPSGTSKFYLIKNVLTLITHHYPVSKLIPFPEDDERFDMSWLFQLCKDIETDPIKYHLRSASKSLCEHPQSLNDLNQLHNEQSANLLNLISLIVHIFDIDLEALSKSSKIPKFESVDEPQLAAKFEEIQTKVGNYLDKDWNIDDIVLRLGTGGVSLYVKVQEMVAEYGVRVENGEN